MTSYKMTLVLVCIIAIAFIGQANAYLFLSTPPQQRIYKDPTQLFIDVDKQRGFTSYDLCIKSQVPIWNPNDQRINIAFQWFRSDGSYENLIFKLKIPVLTRHYPTVMDIKKGKSWYDHQIVKQDEYLKEILVDNFASTVDPDIDLDSLYVKYERDFNQLDGVSQGDRICISFNLNIVEPIGTNKLQLAWQFYDDSTKCYQFKYCLQFNRAHIWDEPVEYYHGKYFSDDYDISFIVALYWADLALSCIPILGPSLVSIVNITMLLYVQIVAGFQIGTIMAAGVKAFDDEQNKLYSFKNWWNESVMFWNLGTFVFTSIYYVLSWIPLVGQFTALQLTFITMDILLD